MPSSKSTIVPLAIAYIQAHGPQTAASISKGIGYDIWSLRKALMNAVDFGQLSVVREPSPAGRVQNRYSLVKRVWIPKISVGKWRGYRATGSRPEDNRRIAS